MKTKAGPHYLVIIILSLVAVCLTAHAHLVNTASFLTSAGFRMCKPETPEQRLLYGTAPSYRLLRAGSPWENFYAYKDEAAGVAYVGGEAEYRRFQQIAAQEGFARGAYLPADMELDPAWRWAEAFGVRHVWTCRQNPELSPK